MNSSRVGESSEAQILAAFLRNGVPVLLPFGSSHRYDMVIEMGSFKRVQCKTGRVRNGAIEANCSSISAPHRGGKRRNYRGDADLFAIYCSEIDAVYLIPVDEAPTVVVTLRLAPSKNNQLKAIRLAEDYRQENFMRKMGIEPTTFNLEG